MRIRRSSRSLAQWVFPTEFKDKEDLFVESLRRYFDSPDGTRTPDETASGLDQC